MTNRIDKEGLRAVVLALEAEDGHRTRAAESLGMHRSTFLHRLKQARAAGLLNDGGPGTPDALACGGNAELTIALPPDGGMDVDELVEHRIQAFDRKARHEAARALIPVTVRDALPIGVLHLGDPHVDDDGTDLALLRRDSDLTRTVEGLYAANVGDTTNNWVGRLGRLYGEQETSSAQAWQLAEWLIRRTRWMYLVGGNHDCHDVQTEALTRRGWVRGPDIRDDDEVLALNPESGAAEWVPIQARILRPHDGEMVRIQARSMSALVTPNHRVLHKARKSAGWDKDWSFAPAGELPARFAVPVSAVNDRAGVPLSDDQIALAGWILTDGSIQTKGNSPRVSIWQSKCGAEIERVLKGCGLAYTEVVRDRDITHVCGRPLVKPPMPQREYRLNAGESRKVLAWVPAKGALPAWCEDMNARQFGVLLDALIDGDGCWDGVSPEQKNCAVLHGTHEFLSEVQALAVRNGWNARISVARGKDARLNLCRRESLQFERSAAVTREQYSGDVWCLTVQHGNFMVRRDGAAHFSGNCWSGSGDPLRWIAMQAGAFYQDSEVRVELRFPNGARFRINCRHDFAGNSIWNPTHGVMKAIQMGMRDHIAICGHKHVSGYGILKDPATKAVCHAIQVGSYKTFDRYARERGFRDQMLGPACVTTINPLLPDTHPDAIKVFWDAEEGADYLTFIRERAKK